MTLELLLDTNALLWLVAEPERVGPAAMNLLADPGTMLYVSAASAWEISIKTQSGRLDASPLLTGWHGNLSAMRMEEIAMDSADAIAAGQLQWENRDPFDRMIAAQAIRRQLRLATSDTVMLRAAIVPTLDTR